MAYTYEQVFAADPANPANIAQNAAITIFAPGDVTMTPLTITDPDGQPLANPIPVNANGFGSAFAHATLDRVAWAGGGFTGFFTSYEGMKNEAVAARTAAESAATTAGADAAAVATAAIGDATNDATAAAASAATAASNASASAAAAANSASLVAAPADTAVQTLINNSGSSTRAALNATYASALAADGASPTGVIATAAKKVSQPRLLATTADAFPAPTISQISLGLVGLGANNVQYYVQNPNTLRRSPDRGVSIYNMTVPANVTDAFISCQQVYEWKGYAYAIFKDSTANRTKLYRANYNTTNLWDAVTWTEILTLTDGALGYGFTISGTSQALIVGEYGDPQTAGVKTAKLWRTTDGTTFTAVKTYGTTYRHVHCVAADPLNDGHIWVSGGDNVNNCFSISTDHGATWTDFGGLAWQATQLSFTADYVYASPDAVSLASLFVIDRPTRTPKVGAINSHRSLNVAEMGAYTQGSTNSTTAFTDPTGPFVANDKGRSIIGAGIPAGTTIATYNSATSVTLSVAATATASPLTYAIGRVERPRGYCFQGAVDPATGIYYGVANADITAGAPATYARPLMFAVPYPGGPVVHVMDLEKGGAAVHIGQGRVWYGHVSRPLLTL